MRHKSPILQAHHVPADFYCTDLTSQKDLINQQDSAVFLSLTRLSIINQVIIQPDKQSTQCYSFGNCNKREGRAEGGRSFSSMLRLQENIKKKKNSDIFRKNPMSKAFVLVSESVCFIFRAVHRYALKLWGVKGHKLGLFFTL